MKYKINNDESALEDKIQLRVDSLPEKKEINILEAFGGEGIIWNKITARLPDRKFNILSIDKKDYSRVQLKGDSARFMQTMDLDKFDLIDLDAYGAPVDQLEIIFKKQYKGIVHVTLITSQLGGLDSRILYANGYIPEMLKKIRLIFEKDFKKVFFNYLAMHGVEGVTYIQHVEHFKKLYLYFSLKKPMEKNISKNIEKNLEGIS